MAPPASKTSRKQSASHKRAAHTGHTGHTSSSGGATPSKVTRQESRHLSPVDLQNYRDGIAQMQGISDNRGFQVLAG
jgi:hypothetical protein